MPRASGPDVEVLGVAAVNPAQQQSQRVTPLRYDDEMNVVAHEAPPEHAGARLDQVVAQQAEVVARSISVWKTGQRSTPRCVTWCGRPSTTQRCLRRIISVSAEIRRDSGGAAMEFATKIAQVRLSLFCPLFCPIFHFSFLGFTPSHT